MHKDFPGKFSSGAGVAAAAAIERLGKVLLRLSAWLVLTRSQQSMHKFLLSACFVPGINSISEEQKESERSHSFPYGSFWLSKGQILIYRVILQTTKDG